MSSPLPLLGRTVLALLLVVGLPQFAHAAFIDLVSASYHIYASGHSIPPFFEPAVVEYDETSDMPIGRADDHFEEGFSLVTFTDGGATDTSAFVQTMTSTSGGGAETTAHASATMTFRPLVTDMVVTVGLPSRVFGSASLYDDTAGGALLAFEPNLPPFFGSASYVVSLNLEHVYSIYAATSDNAPMGGRGIRRCPRSKGSGSLPFRSRTAR